MYLLYLRRQFEKYVKNVKSAGGELPDDFPIPFVVPLNTDASRLALFGDPARGQQHMHALNSDHQWRALAVATAGVAPKPSHLLTQYFVNLGMKEADVDSLHGQKLIIAFDGLDELGQKVRRSHLRGTKRPDGHLRCR